MTVQQKILLGLARGHQVIRLGEYSWRWKDKWEGRPPLRNPDTSALMRRDLVTEEAAEMKLTASGKVHIAMSGAKW